MIHRLILLLLFVSHCFFINGCSDRGKESENKANATIKTLQDSIIALKQFAKSGYTEHNEESVSNKENYTSNTKYVFCEIITNYHPYWDEKTLIKKKYLCAIAELPSYDEDAKYKFLDKIEAKIKNLDLNPQAVYVYKEKMPTLILVSKEEISESNEEDYELTPSKRHKVLSRELHVFDSYAEASKALELLK